MIMFKIGTITTINDQWSLKNVHRDDELSFSTIEIELEYAKGKFIYPIHFDYVLEKNVNLDELIVKHLKTKEV